MDRPTGVDDSTRKRLYLASSSPRRQQMIRWLGIPVETLTVEVDERALPHEAPPALAARLAQAKAREARRTVGGAAWVLAADTVVDLDGQPLGKPAHDGEAAAMLRELRGRVHKVHTGVALAFPKGQLLVRRVTTFVRMRAYSEEDLRLYVASGDPRDKAGAYAIQHRGFQPVEEVEVCYANVVGLPLCAVVRLLLEAGWPLTVNVRALCARHFDYACPRPDPGEVL